MARCLSLAQAMSQPVTFFLDPGAAWRDELTRLGIPWRQEHHHESADNLAQAQRDGEINAVLVDGYDFSTTAVSTLAGQGITAIIDDFGQPRGAQIMVNPSLAAGAVGHLSSDPVALCGSSFALLNTLYAEEHERIAPLIEDSADSHEAQRCRILVSLGAYDGANCTQLVLQALQRLSASRIDVRVVLGAQAPHLASIQQYADARNIRVVVGPDNLLALYRWADFAIGAAGVSLLERMCCGVPSALILLAENQRANCEAAEQLGCAQFFGAFQDLNEEVLANRLAPIVDDAALRHRLRVAGLAVIDGRGSTRVANYLQNLA